MSHFKLSKSFVIPLIMVVLVDQSSKIIAQQHRMVIYNSGVSLGLFTLVPKLFLSLALLVLLVGVGLMFRSIWQQIPVASSFFFGGGLSNLLDRFFLTGVRDWLPIPLMTIHNNLADYAIGLGLISMIFFTLRKTYEVETHQGFERSKDDIVAAKDEDS